MISDFDEIFYLGIRAAFEEDYLNQPNFYTAPLTASII